MDDGTCGRYVVFAGGTDNPYNYDGIGYDGAPSPAIGGVFRVQRRHADMVRPAARRRDCTDDGPPRLPITRGAGWIVGGMLEAQRVSDRLIPVPLSRCAM